MKRIVPFLSVTEFPDHTVLLEREILLHDSIDFKAKVLIEFHVLFVVGL